MICGSNDSGGAITLFFSINEDGKRPTYDGLGTYSLAQMDRKIMNVAYKR